MLPGAKRGAKSSMMARISSLCSPGLRDVLAGCDFDRNTILLAFSGILGDQRFTLGQISGEVLMPNQGVEGTQQGQRGRFDLIDGIGAVHRAVRLVRIVEDQTGIAKLMHGLSAHRLAGVGSIVLAIMHPRPIHDGGDAPQWIFCVSQTLSGVRSSKANRHRAERSFCWARGTDGAK